MPTPSSSSPAPLSSDSLHPATATDANPLRNAAERIDAVLFDYGMVLSGPADPAAWARLRVVSGLDEKHLHVAYWALRHDYDRGALTGTAYWQAVAAHAAVAAFDNTQLAALKAADIDLWAQLNTPMVEWSARLQRAGLRTGILSNIGDDIAAGIVARFPWLARFDHCTWSHAFGLAKPDPAIYIETAKALQVAPGNVLFIDDRAENIAAADALGMQALHYTTHPAFEREMRARGLDCLLNAGLSAATGEAPSRHPLRPDPQTAAK